MLRRFVNVARSRFRRINIIARPLCAAAKYKTSRFTPPLIGDLKRVSGKTITFPPPWANSKTLIRTHTHTPARRRRHAPSLSNTYVRSTNFKRTPCTIRANWTEGSAKDVGFTCAVCRGTQVFLRAGE